jgi:hypothetical protein
MILAGDGVIMLATWLINLKVNWVLPQPVEPAKMAVNGCRQLTSTANNINN